MTNTPSVTIDHESSLFTYSVPKDRFPILTSITLGILCVQEIDLDPARLYLVDSQENNEYFVYDREVVGRAKKTLWKVKEYKIEKVESVPKKFDLTVRIDGVPCFDQEFGSNTGSWLKLDYDVHVQLSISGSRVGSLKESSAPLRIIRNRMIVAARSVLPFLSYQEALTANVKENLADWLRGYDEVMKVGVTVEMVEIEKIAGSEKLADVFSGRFQRLLEAKDKSDTAMMFAQLDDDARRAYLTMGGAPDAGNILAAMNRMSDQTVKALLASGYSPADAYRFSVQSLDKSNVNMPIDATEISLQRRLAEQTFTMIKDTDWEELKLLPELLPPNEKNHSNRLEWERNVLKERIPLWLLENADESEFLIKIGDANTLQIRWDDPKSVPQAWINGKPRQNDFAILSPSAWNPERRTIWDIYQTARSVLNVQ